MAIVYANINGTWATPEIWDVIEEGSSEITHRVPANGDYVYANGHIVSSVPLDCTGIIISNEANEDYGIIGGGYFSTVNASTPRAYFKEIHQGGGARCLVTGNSTSTNSYHSLNCEKITTTDNVAINFSWSNYGGRVNLMAQQVRGHYNLFSVSGSNTSYLLLNVSIADCIMYDGATLIGGTTITTLNYTGNYTGVLCNGNVTTLTFSGTMDLLSPTSRTISTLTANGSYTLTGSQVITTGNYYGDLTLNDGTTISGTTGNINRAINIGNNCVISYTNLTFNNADGVVRVGHGSCYSATTHTFNGRKIEYYNDSNGIGGITSTNPFNPINEDFQWINISEPRVLKYRIMTDYDFDNTEQYPAENRVVQGVEYAFGEKTGTFSVDYPQEAVVLKDVTYDSGNKTGKLVVLPAELISRLLNCPTIETMQQLLIAHLNPETD